MDSIVCLPSYSVHVATHTHTYIHTHTHTHTPLHSTSSIELNTIEMTDKLISDGTFHYIRAQN